MRIILKDFREVRKILWGAQWAGFASAVRGIRSVACAIEQIRCITRRILSTVEFSKPSWSCTDSNHHLISEPESNLGFRCQGSTNTLNRV
jgi:hypothetical protein